MITSSKDFVGQERLRQLLGRYLAQDRLRGTLLLLGQRGLGKTTLATMIARALCCESKAAPSAELDFCGDCYACRSIASGNQPEFSLLRPLGTQFKVEQLDASSGVLHRMSLHPVNLRWRILVLDEAHCLNEETANQMLKLLEEPPQRSIFILTSDRPPLTQKTSADAEGILPTITSRALQLRLQPLPRWQLEEDLARRLPGNSNRSLREASFLSGGRFVDALALAQDEQWRASLFALAWSLAKGRDVLECAASAQECEFGALWAKEQRDSGLSAEELERQCSESYKQRKDEPPPVMSKQRHTELRRQALAQAYDRATRWLLHEASRGLDYYPHSERRRPAPALPSRRLASELAVLKQRIFANVDSQLAQAAFEASLAQ